jgi:hypothetical protein
MAETIATYSVPEHHVSMFTGNVRARLSKMGGLLSGLVTRGSYRGEKVQVVNFIGEVEFIERDTPYADTKLTELEHTSRWISGKEYDAAVLIDRLDTLKMIYDPTSPYVESFRRAAARKFDEIIMDSFFAVAKSGKTGSVDTPYYTGNTIVNGGTGFTVAKLRSLRKLIKKRHVDLRSTTPLIAVNAEAIDDLLAETVVGSFDYNAVKPLVDGEVGRFMGFNFVPYEDWNGKGIALGGGSVRTSPVWIPEAMHFGLWDDLIITINNRPDKNNIKQIHGTFTAGATRLEEQKVFGLEWVEA